MVSIPYELRLKIFVLSGLPSQYLEAFHLQHDTIWVMSRIDFSTWTLANERKTLLDLSKEKNAIDILTLGISQISHK